MNIYRMADDDVEICLDQLTHIVDTIPAQLRAFNFEIFDTPLAEGKWSRKQIIGHLIDSATNNHHRFVRGQFDNAPTILYDQEKWNAFSYYEQMDGQALIDFWELYNRHLIRLMENMSPEMREKTCTMSDGQLYTIAWLFEDYVRHLEHHLRQIFV
jgi:hypothetical protein